MPRARRRPFAGLVAAVTCAVLALSGLGWALSPTARGDQDHVDLPGGKASFVVSAARLDPASEENWVRLSTYSFFSNGNVTAQGWVWSQTDAAKADRIGTGVTPGTRCSTTSGDTGKTVVRACEIQTVEGFTAGKVPETRTGTFVTRNGALSIAWSGTHTWTENWTVDVNPAGKLARLTFVSNTWATHGFGYGSNASLQTRQPMSVVQSFAGTLKQDYYGWTQGTLNANAKPGQPFTIANYKTCDTTTTCLTFLQASSTACSKDSCPRFGYGGTGVDVTSIQYYMQAIGGKDRRDTLWHWCTCLQLERNADLAAQHKPQEFCYQGNSHIKPLLQILDDDGAFHGYVGAEASFWPNAAKSGHSARYSDMLGTFRFTDFR